MHKITCPSLKFAMRLSVALTQLDCPNVVEITADSFVLVVDGPADVVTAASQYACQLMRPDGVEAEDDEDGTPMVMTSHASEEDDTKSSDTVTTVN